MKSTHCRLVVGLIVASLMGAALIPAVSATTLFRMSDEDMAIRADLVASGRAGSVSYSRLNGAVMTLVTVELDDVLKGQAQGAVTVIVPGGVDMSLKFPVATTYPGAPRIFEGQDLLLFLERSPAMENGYGVVGFSQGAYAVAESPDGIKRVSRDLSGVRFQDQGKPSQGAARSLTLDAFKAQIREYLAADSAREQK